MPFTEENSKKQSLKELPPIDVRSIIEQAPYEAAVDSQLKVRLG